MPRNKLLPHDDPHRCTGRTTALALRALATAISNQGHPVVAVDHYPGPPRSAAEVMYQALRRCEKQLELKHIEVRIDTARGCCVVTSNIWE